MAPENDFPYEELTNALVSAFPGYDNLDMMVTFKLGTPLERIHQRAQLDYVALQVVRWAKSRGKVDDLIAGALNQNPENPDLLALAESFDLDEGAGKFERVVIDTVPMTDVEDWRSQMMRCERAVCRVEVNEQGIGTGFLVGTNLVLTNYHVVSEVIGGGWKPESLSLRFDYKMKTNKTVQKGKQYKLLAGNKWLAGSSPIEVLDYALLRVAGKPANESVAAQPGAPTRGFLSPAAYEFKQGDPLFIIQHPQATPLKFAPGSVDDAKVGMNRVAYTVNTDAGSSGSPCFTSDWTPVALHHWGGEDHNRGVVFSAILEDWGKNGLSEEVGQ
jgi:Trypsin-like peptidase domain/Effector-associated domain 1